MQKPWESNMRVSSPHQKQTQLCLTHLLSTPTETCLADIVFTRDDIEKACSELSPRSAAGGDGVPASLLKTCKTPLSLPLLILWIKSLAKGSIPSSLLQAVICPLHKGGSRSVPKNFCPVALTSYIIKVFERVIQKFLVSYIEANYLMTRTAWI